MEKYYFDPMDVDLNNTYLFPNKSSVFTEEEIKNKKHFVSGEEYPLFTIDEIPDLLKNYPGLKIHRNLIDGFISKEDKEYEIIKKIANAD